jgi:gag-polyprotein putative aspartyl protease
MRLVLDSGAQRTFISNRKRKKAGIKVLDKVEGENYYGQSFPATLGLADSLTLNGLTIHNLPLISAAIPIPGTDGLLGWDLLRHFAIEIDYVHQWLIIRRSVPDSTLATNLLGGSRPMIIGYGPTGNQLNFFLDTGSSEAVRISPTGSTKIGQYKTGRKINVGGGVGRLIRIEWQTHVRSLCIDIDGKQRRFKRIGLFNQDEVIGMFIRDGLIGGRAFRKGRLTLDAPNHHFSYKE